MDNFYENDNYVVALHQGESVAKLEEAGTMFADGCEVDGAFYTTFYTVTNKATEVVEFKHPMYPVALHNAESLNLAILKEHHLWLRKAEEQIEESPLAEAATSPTVVN